MNTKNFKLILIIILLITISCNQKNKKVAIEYNDLSKLTRTSYISIDGLVIPHTDNEKYIRYNKALPLEYINTFNSNSNNAPMFKTNKNIILERLKKILALEKEYKFDSSFFVSLNSRLIISRIDGKPLKIKTSKNYPANIVFRE